MKELIFFKNHLMCRHFSPQTIKEQFQRVHYRERDYYLGRAPKEVIDENLTNSISENRIFCENIPGRHIVVRYFNKLVKITNLFVDSSESDHKFVTIVKKHKNLMDHINGAVKKVLAKSIFDDAF
jgi:hypothetical protein